MVTEWSQTGEAGTGVLRVNIDGTRELVISYEGDIAMEGWTAIATGSPNRHVVGDHTLTVVSGASTGQRARARIASHDGQTVIAGLSGFS